jgi:hypothetical protein
MNRTLRRVLRIVMVGVVLIVAFYASLLLAMNFALPTSETLARWYLGEVTSGTDAELDTAFLRCASLYVERDRARYAGAEIRDLQVATAPSGGSSDTIEFVTLSFAYRLPGATAWETGEINTLMSDFALLRPRRLFCAG